MQKTKLALLCVALASVCLAGQPPFDLVIVNGLIIDGSGNPWYAADVGIRSGRIAAVGTLSQASARDVIDARGMVVAPGFVDVHTHADRDIRKIPTADNFLLDGVTSIIAGNCGGSETNLEGFFSELRATRISINMGTLIGHNSLRRTVIASEQRDPTPGEQEKMEALVEQAMCQGAMGLSTGLIYTPGTFAKTPEVMGLARAAARHSGLYASHIRDEGEGLFDAIGEALSVGREAGVPVQIAHFKVANRKLWNQSTRSIAMIEQARASGVDVTVDQYPYVSSSTGLGMLLPSWALAGGQEQLLIRLRDASSRKKIATEMKDVISRRNGRKRLDYATVARCEWDAALEGKNISQINRQNGRKGKLGAEIETVLDMMEKGGASMVYQSMDEQDVERILRYPYTMVGSDGGIQEKGRGVPHPRSYGTNARVLARYVREKKVLRLEDAIRKMTSFPAQRFRLTDRGLVRPGMWADLVVFDPETVADTATFQKPHSYAAGFAYVIVNGEIVVREGKHTGARSGQILLGPGTVQHGQVSADPSAPPLESTIAQTSRGTGLDQRRWICWPSLPPEPAGLITSGTLSVAKS